MIVGTFVVLCNQISIGLLQRGKGLREVGRWRRLEDFLLGCLVTYQTYWHALNLGNPPKVPPKNEQKKQSNHHKQFFETSPLLRTFPCTTSLFLEVGGGVNQRLVTWYNDSWPSWDVACQTASCNDGVWRPSLAVWGNRQLLRWGFRFSYDNLNAVGLLEMNCIIHIYIYRYLCNDNYFHYHYHCHCVNVWYIFIFSTSLFSYLHVHSKHRPPRWLCLGFPTVKTSHKKYAMIDIRSLKLAVRPRKYAFPKGHWSSNPILLRDCFREGNFGTNKCRSLFFVGGSTKTRP